jgi:hypothetical protein
MIVDSAQHPLVIKNAHPIRTAPCLISLRCFELLVVRMEQAMSINGRVPAEINFSGHRPRPKHACRATLLNMKINQTLHNNIPWEAINSGSLTLCARVRELTKLYNYSLINQLYFLAGYLLLHWRHKAHALLTILYCFVLVYHRHEQIWELW